MSMWNWFYLFSWRNSIHDIIFLSFTSPINQKLSLCFKITHTLLINSVIVNDSCCVVHILRTSRERKKTENALFHIQTHKCAITTYLVYSRGPFALILLLSQASVLSYTLTWLFVSEINSAFPRLPLLDTSISYFISP